MDQHRSRRPKGIPAGGQFAPDLRAVPDVSLGSSPTETAAEYAYRTAAEWAQGDPHLAQAQRALLDGSARSLLAERFAASGMDDAQLATAVGAPRIVARRVVSGKEALNATTVAAYLRAMDTGRQAG